MGGVGGGTRFAGERIVAEEAGLESEGSGVGVMRAKLYKFALGEDEAVGEREGVGRPLEVGWVARQRAVPVGSSGNSI